MIYDVTKKNIAKIYALNKIKLSAHNFTGLRTEQKQTKICNVVSI